MRTRVSLSVVYILLITPSASADFVGVTTVNKDDPDTEFLCTQGNGDNVPGPLTICNVFAAFDDPDDRLLTAAIADLQVYNGANPDVFFQHPFNFNGSTSPDCDLIPAFPDLICDSFITIGFKCSPSLPEFDRTQTDGDFQPSEFQFNGNVVGGWYNAVPSNGQGDAGTWPDLKVLFFQSSVLRGHSMSGDIHLFWIDSDGEIFTEADVPVECVATCGSCPTDSDADGDTDAADLAVLLGNWGPCGPGVPCECLDNDSSGSIDAFDLAVLLGAWGPCL